MRDALAMLRAEGLPERVVIDASHDNSDKVPARQIVAAARSASRSPPATRRSSASCSSPSSSRAARAATATGELTYGQSITDACIAWEDTLSVLDGLAQAVRARRGR